VGIVLPASVEQVTSLQLCLSYEAKQLILDDFKLLPNNVLQVLATVKNLCSKDRYLNLITAKFAEMMQIRNILNIGTRF
jgi:ABC-type uncharacterized transport system ATPase subunit